ncbi:EAL domain-containing protein [Oceanobacillus bengalensis]|nr:EAL domain-containing protein [Oceanobacillus bengalensis]
MHDNEKINILLVDDRPENLLAIEAIIEKEEYNLVKASSGEEALKFLLKNTFAVILLDVQMPGMDGFSTAKIIKAREKTKNIPILFITANNLESEHIFMGYSVGAIDYILKPVDPLILKAKVEGFVGIYKMRQQLITQATTLAEKTTELEAANKELSELAVKLRLSETLANVISETSKDSMLILDENGTIIKVNPSVRQMFQYSEDELIGKNIRILFTEDTANRYIEKVFDTIQTFGTLRGFDHQKEVSINRKDETSIIVDLQFGLKFLQDRYIVACTIRDITEQKENEALIKKMAYYDALTTLPNRRAWRETVIDFLQIAKSANQSLGIMFLDMDRFKNINDSLGNQMGDRVLQKIAKRIVTTLSEEDYVARISGDKFAILLANTNRDSALVAADRIRDAFRQALVINNYELYLTMSIGLSIFPYDGEDYSELVKNADAALYHAKEIGQNNYHVFHAGMNIQSYRSFMMQNELYKAIDRKEFEILYQPRINVKTGKVESAEAMIRWNHLNWGSILPKEFIPLAEQTGQIVAIDKWVLESVCHQLKEWKKAGMAPIRIAFHFSAQQFLQTDVVDDMKRILKETNVSPNLLEIKITESALLNNEKFSKSTLQHLMDLGICISIDDFGTGYSSLHYLKELPVSILKVDRSFVQGIMDKKSKNRAIITGIISLAKALKLSIIAEGVETEEQFEFFKLHECDEVQGYLFSPPAQRPIFEKMIVDGKYEVKSTDKPPVTMEEKRERLQKSNPVPQALKKLKEMYTISQRELEVFELILAGLSNKEISQRLFISEHTVKNHISHIFQKLVVTDRAQAMALVYRYCISDGE